jgi:hypothetical protein
MVKMKNLKELSRILEDHERRIAALEGKPAPILKVKTLSGAKKGSTAEKITSLISEGFFNKPRSIGEIISEFKTQDYHLKASELTMPLRCVVRKGLLKRTKKYSNGTDSKVWLYVRVKYEY